MSMSRFTDYMAKRGLSAAPAPENPLAEAAIRLGLPCFPCDANKQPLTQHGFKDASTDPAQIRRWFTNAAAVMIGVPTGEITGVVVVDVDMKDGQQGRAWLDANSHRMPQTRTIRTGSGGLHIYLTWPSQRVKNSASKIAPNIDVRGDGGYVIVPPSVGYSVADDAPVAEVPDWLMPALCPPEAPPAPPPVQAPQSTISEGGSILGREALAQRCDAIRNAWDGAKHAAVNEGAFAIGGLVSAGHLEEAAAWAELRAALADILPRCKDKGAAERTLKRAFQEGMGRPQNVEPPEPKEEVHPAAPFLAKLYAVRAKQDAKPLPVPVDIMQPGGVLQMLVEECVRTALRPQPFLALGAAICAVGALAGRKYRTKTDLRTNIYVAAVAESGGGKDHAPEVIRRCFDIAKLDRYLGGETIASGRAVLSSLEQHPAKLFQVDEFGLFLASVTGNKAPGHKAEIWSELMKLYSRAKGIYRGTEYADKKLNARVDINQPCVCFCGTTTPSTFWRSLEGGAMMDGSLARFLVFVTDNDRPDRNRDAGLIQPSDALIEALKAISRGQGTPPGPGNLPDVHVVPMTSTDEPTPYTVQMTAEAEAFHDAKLLYEDTWARKVAGTPEAAIVNRLGENAAKLALVCAVSRNPSHPEITPHDIQWGWALAIHCTETLLKDAKKYIADSDFERRLNKLVQIITEHGPITEAMIVNRHSFRIPPRERADMLRDLVAMGAITRIDPDPNKPGPKTPRYAIGGLTDSQTADCIDENEGDLTC